MFASAQKAPLKRRKANVTYGLYKYAFAMLCFVSLLGYVCFRAEIHSSIMGGESVKKGMITKTFTNLKSASTRYIFGGVGGDGDGGDGDDGDDDCKDLSKAEDKCAYVSQNCQFSNFVNYMKLRYCYMSHVKPALSLTVCICLFMLICLVLMSVLGSVGGVFFVSSLVTISKKLNVSSSVSGITFLAFGNGSPDIFSALAASRASNFNLLQGSLMGASVCLSTFVLGLIIYHSNGLAHISASFFWRSFVGYAICMIAVIGFCANGHVNFLEGVLLVLLYVVYVAATVIYLQVQKCKQTRREKDDMVAISRARRGVGEFPSLQAPLLDDVTDVGFALNTLPRTDSEEKEEEDDNIEHQWFLEGVSWPHPDWEEQGFLQRSLGKITHVLAFPLSLALWMSIPATQILPHRFTTVKRMLTLLTPLGSAFMLCCDLYEPGALHDHSKVQTFLILLSCGAAMSFALILFFFFVALPRNERYIQRREEVRSQVAELIAANPADDLIDRLTAEWDLDEEDDVAADVSVHILHVVLSVLALGGSIIWLSLIADEVVALLQTVGIMSGISSILIGLTVVALANSLPDAISNSALAKSGHYDTSFSAVIFAPLLTTLVGLGLSITTNVKNQPGESYRFPVDVQLIYTWVAVCTALVAHMIIFPMYKYNPPKWYGIGLIMSYGLFLVGSVLIELFA